MIASASVYDQLAALVAYPSVGYVERLRDCWVSLGAEHPRAAEALQPFIDYAARLELPEIEEAFTRTFDINPVCCLEVGWQLFGEEYARGAFLVKMRGLLREQGLSESAELPDHLVHILPLLGRLEPGAADALAATAVIPALDKMLAGFAGKDDPYEHVLRAIRAVLAARHAVSSGGDADA